MIAKNHVNHDFLHVKHPLYQLVFLILLVRALLSVPAVAAADSLKNQSRDHVIEVGKIANPAIDELSGLAPSQLNSSVLWALNDGGNPALLFAVGTDGKDLGSIPIAGARNRDWEDISSFKCGNAAYLLIADTGDNHHQRKSYTIYIVKEPKITDITLQNNLAAEFTTRINFTYEDGPLDCEAVAVDVNQGKILLLSKRTLPVALYELPLDLEKKNLTAIARRKVNVSDTVTMPTAMDISPYGDTAVVLTYKTVYLLVRRTGEDWSKAFTRKPQMLVFKALPQQEAICFAGDGQSAYVTSEGQSASLMQINLKTVPSYR